MVVRIKRKYCRLLEIRKSKLDTGAIISGKKTQRTHRIAAGTFTLAHRRESCDFISTIEI